MTERQDERQSRVLLLPATRRDGQTALKVLGGAGIDCEVLADFDQLIARLANPHGALVITDTALAASGFRQVVEQLALQPAWSDLPVVLLARTDGQATLVQEAINRITNLTVIDRPSSVRSLISTVQAALRARARQYQIRDQLESLVKADDALRAADKSKDLFLATLAHELRNPLAPLRSAMQVIELRSDPNDKQSAKLTGIMDRQMSVMVRLIDDLLDIARISSGKVTMKRELLDVRAAVDLALETARPGLTAANHAVELDRPDTPLWVLGDLTRLTQVFGNILNNSAKYTPAGGRVRISIDQADLEVVVAIEDTGVGIPEPLLKSVFDMFSQVNQTLDRAQGGLGIGLALAQKVVELHAGSIEASSAGEHQGSKFTVRLPSAAPQHQASGNVAIGGGGLRSSNETMRVLIVDDNQDAADALALLLESQGHSVQVQYSGHGAIASLREFRPEVIYCDIGMPRMNGHEFAEVVRSDALLKPLVLAALSGWSTDADRQRSADSGFDIHLTKPASATELVEVFKLAALRRARPDAGRSPH